MKEKNKGFMLEIVVTVILLVFYNIAVFLLFKQKGEAFWSAYIFTTLAILAQAIVPVITFHRSIELKDVFLGLPVLQLSVLYLVLQAVISILIMLIRVFPLAWAIVVQLALLVVYMIMIISALLVRECVDKVDRTKAQKTVFIKMLRADVEILTEKAKEPEIRKALKHLSDQVRYADPVSNDALRPIEEQIAHQLQMLRDMLESGQNTESIKAAVDSVEALVNERAIRCRLLK